MIEMYRSKKSNLTSTRLRPWYSVSIAWLIALAFAAVEARRVASQIAVRYPDFFGAAKWASRFDVHHLTEWRWAGGLYPMGYRLLLRLGVESGLDVLSTAFVLSILGGIIGLLGTFILIRQLTQNWILALFTEALLASTAHYLFFASLDSTDMLAAGLQILSIAVLFADNGRQISSSAEDEKALPVTQRASFKAGILAGLSYLIRYTASLTIMLCTIYLVVLIGIHWFRPERYSKRQWTIPIAYLLGAAAGAAPQLIASTLVEGNPFYTIQTRNLWFHLTGSSDYIFDWHSAPENLSLWYIVRTYPKRLITHWWNQFRSFWTTQDAVVLDNLFAQLMHAGLLFTLLAPTRLKRSKRVFLGLYIIGHIALLSLIRLDKRFLIVLMPPLAFGTIYFLWHILPSHLKGKQISIPLRIPVLILLTIWSMQYPLKFMRSNLGDEETIKVSNILHAAGMESADQVYSTHVRYHDVADPWKRRFAQASVIAPSLASYNDLLKLLRSRDYQFFIYDDGTGRRLYPDLEFLLSPEARPEGLAPIYVHEEREHAIYRVLDDESPAYQEVDAIWANGITLKGYETHLSGDMPRRDQQQRLGVYLHWQATQPVTKMLKVFVHVMDANDQLIAQHDGIPALWTYPTNKWNTGETVVDFHPVVFEETLPSGVYTIRVGLYAEDTGRVAVLDSSGASVGDTVTLKMTIP